MNRDGDTSGGNRIELEAMPVQTRGHHQIYDPASPGRLSGSVLDAVLHRVRDTDTWTDAYASVFGGTFSCAMCDAHPSFDVVADPNGPQGLGLRARSECVLPHGARTVRTLTVASGRVVVADDLRPVFDAPLPRCPGYSSAAGQMAYAQTMASLGVARGMTTNGARDLVCLERGRYAIVTHDAEFEADDPMSGGHLSRLGYPGAKSLVEVSGPVCSYAIADHEHWSSAAADRGLNPEALLGDSRGELAVAEMDKGVYLVVDHTTLAGHDAEDLGRPGEPTVYTDITWLSPLLPDWD